MPEMQRPGDGRQAAVDSGRCPFVEQPHDRALPLQSLRRNESHRGDRVSGTCPVCEAQQDASLLCSACCDRLERELGDVAALVGELDITLSKQARIGVAGAPGLARERTPINVGAMQAADNLGNVLTTWARDLGHGINGWWTPGNTCKVAAVMLLRDIPAIRRHAAVVELVDEISDAIHQARRAVDRPADRVYLGQCLMETPDDEGRPVTCLNELYARPQAREVQCKVCSAEHPVAERRAWLLQRAQDVILSVKDASLMIGEIGGIKVSQASIRGYLHRGKLAYRPGVTNGIRLGDLLTVVLDESERKSA
jgi:hypothetical protein